MNANHNSGREPNERTLTTEDTEDTETICPNAMLLLSGIFAFGIEFSVFSVPSVVNVRDYFTGIQNELLIRNMFAPGAVSDRKASPTPMGMPMGSVTDRSCCHTR